MEFYFLSVEIYQVISACVSNTPTLFVYPYISILNFPDFWVPNNNTELRSIVHFVQSVFQPLIKFIFYFRLWLGDGWRWSIDINDGHNFLIHRL